MLLGKDIPILGVCLGMQLLAKIENSKNVLVRNETPIEHKQRGEQYVHDLNIVDGTKLHEILQKRYNPRKQCPSLSYFTRKSF